MKNEIARSRAQCLKCFDIIESKHRHDFVRCKCGAIFLDGGQDYVRYGFEYKTDINLLTEYQRGRGIEVTFREFTRKGKWVRT